MGIKILKQSLILVYLFLISVKLVQAATIAENSAQFFDSTDNINYQLSLASFYKKLAIKKILERYNSPLVASTNQFINTCNRYGIDCYLLPAIAGLESFFGHFVYPNSYNPFGWGGGYIMFNNWNEAIEIVGKNLKINYINRGLDSVNKIGILYSESATWSTRINWFIKQFEKEEDEIRLFFLKNQIQL